MESKITLKRVLVVASTIVIIVSSLTIFLDFRGFGHSSKNPSLAFWKQSVSGFPVRIKISTINVDTVVESVGLTNEGLMDVPKDTANTAWFNLGPRPGEKGSSVINGHVDRIDGTPGVFSNLDRLKKGDKLYTEDNEGRKTTFIVRESRIYRESEDASDVFNSDDEVAHLNLITCSGPWSKASKTFLNRLVVFTDMQAE